MNDFQFGVPQNEEKPKVHIPRWLTHEEQATCPSCKRKVKVTIYTCNECGAKYSQPTTTYMYFSAFRCEICGRVRGFGKPRAFRFTCPRCDEVLQSVGVPEIALQLVGGTNAGKTTFLAAFWHLYLKEMAARYPEMSMKADPEAMFDKLEGDFQRGISTATAERNAITYSVVHNRHQLSCQFSFYDIAGEVFAQETYDGEQEQFAYCDGFVVVVDPLNAVDVRRENGIEDTSATYSQDDLNDVVGGFCNKFMQMRALKANRKSSVPVSVIITKADIPTVNRRLSSKRIQMVAQDTFGGNVVRARDEICRGYLQDIGLENALNSLDAMFANIHFFPVSAVGRDVTPGTPYEPWGVMEAVEWILWDKSLPLWQVLQI